MRAGLSIAAVLLATVVSCLGDDPLANENMRGLYVRSIEQVLRLEPEEIDIGTAALIISEQWSEFVQGRQYQERLDEMAFELRDRLDKKGIVAETRAIEEINKYLFEELKFSTVKEADNPDDLFLHSVMDKKQGYCLSLSILYLAIGERLGLPLYGVVVPGHFFVRYDDGNVRFNIETTSKGAHPPDSHYIEKFGVPTDDNETIYLKNLDKLQSLGCLFNNFGSTYISVGDLEQAAEALQRAVWINPSLAESHTNLGNIYLRKGRVDDAIGEYRTALKQNPNDAKTHNNLGNAYAERQWLNDAIGEYAHCIKLEPNYVDAYRNMAIAYRKQQQYGQAQATLIQAMNIEPGNAGLYCDLGGVYSEMGKYEEAIDRYQEALRINATSTDAYYGLAVCYNRLGRNEDEIEACTRALAIKPDMVSAIALLANAHFAAQRYEQALELYNKLLGLTGDDAITYYNIGSAYSNLGKLEEAADAYLKAVGIEPDMGDAHHRLAFTFYRLKNYQLASEHLAKAEQLGVQVDENLAEAIERKL